MENRINGERLKLAKKYRNLTTDDLVQNLNVTRQAIWQYENSINNPSFETLINLTKLLNFPTSFFYERDKSSIKIGNTYFRALAKSRDNSKESQEIKAQFIALLYDILEEFIDLPGKTYKKLQNNDNLTPEVAAIMLRQLWGLEEMPIKNIVNVMEINGIRMAEIETNDYEIDAFTQYGTIDGREYECVVLGKDKNKAARRQFDCAHELGHIILHGKKMVLDNLSREEFRNMEAEANDFAAEFLLPRKSFIIDLIRPERLETYISLKRKWNVSIKAMIVKSFKLKKITPNQYQYLMKQYNKFNMNAEEPYENEIVLSRPMALKKSVELLLTQVEPSFIMNKLIERGYSFDVGELEILLGLDRGTLREFNNCDKLSVEFKKK